jgi:hypothetical protein
MSVGMVSCAPWLEGRAHSVHSQFGEDGLIEGVFDRIGTSNKWCFEVGAGDGVQLSNTKRLRDHGWSAVLIECDDGRFSALAARCTEREHVRCATVDETNLDDLLTGCGIPNDPDLGVIDIDGQDYHVWKGMLRIRPRVMLVEFSPYVKEPGFIPVLGSDGKAGYNQAGFDAICELGEAKGYTAVAGTFCNLLFVSANLI